MDDNSPFEQWRLATIPQVAVSPEILQLLARAFEDGRESRNDDIEQLFHMYQQAVSQRDMLMDQQRAMAAAMRGKLQ